LVHVDTLKTPATDELSSRLQVIGDGIEQLMIAHKPSAIALERVFAQANLRSVMGVAQISGVVLFLAAKYGIPIEMHTPSEVKAAVTGSGRAAKPQIGIAVSKILGLTEIPKPADSADALAIAICNAWKSVGPVSAASKPTKAQAQWLSAQSASKRKGKA
jgi:crossover junction endodeoxyribonuclease RuvC